jgi:ADP-ribosylglycohydrolase
MAGAEDRAIGALLGGALGDAMGMPTQTLSPAEIGAAHGRVAGFVAPMPDHPVSHGLAAGCVTDDTEQALLLARHLLRCRGGFDQAGWVAALLAWEEGVRARGLRDLLGPSTKRALTAIAAGTPPDEAGRTGDTNGAAMRVAPVGIAMPPMPAAALVARVAETCRATHNTSLGIAAAAAVAAAVSAGVAGAGWAEAVRAGIAAAELGAAQGAWAAGGPVAARIDWACGLVAGLSPAAAEARIAGLVGTSVAAQESVPAAFAVLTAARGDPWAAAIMAANLGGDTDTIGAIAAGIAGACTGAAGLPADRLAALQGIDRAEVAELARGLLALRRG